MTDRSATTDTAATTTTDTTTTTPTSVGSDASMRAAVARRYGGPDVVAIDEVPTPSPGAGEVLIAVAATSLNALDWHFLTGTPYFLRLMAGLRRPKRIIPGADVAGTVAQLGDGVTDLDVGDTVFGESAGGGCSTFLTVKAEHVARIAPSVSFEAAAATPVAGLTAIQALRTHAEVQPGEQVLINGAAGGVGTFAVQIAVTLGAEVTAVCSTRNVDMVRRLGATHVVDYTSDDFVPGGARFDVMVDNVGNRSPKECLSVLRPAGRYVAVSGPKQNPWLDPIPHIARTALRFWRADQSFHQFTASANRDDLTALAELLDSGQIVPEIDRVIGIDDVADGLAEIGSGHARAKIVVRPT